MNHQSRKLNQIRSRIDRTPKRDGIIVNRHALPKSTSYGSFVQNALTLQLATLIFTLFSLFSNTKVTAQITFLGNILDANTKEPLIGAAIKASSMTNTPPAKSISVTDEKGAFTMSLPNPGTYKIEISYIGYEDLAQIEEIKIISSKSFTYLLRPGNQLLQTATVTSGKFEKPLSEVTVSLDVIKANIIASTNAQSIESVLQKTPGINMIDGQANIRGGSGYSYGAGSRVLLLIDDIPALQADAGYPNWKDVPVENIEQIEVVKGAASALYGSAAMNGIINVRTGYAKSEPETKIALSYTNYFAPKDPAKKWWTTNTPYGATTSLLHKQKFGKVDLVGSLYYSNTESYLKDTYEKVGRATLGLRYRVTEKLTIGFNANYNRGGSQSFFYFANGGAGAYTGDTSTISTTLSRVRFTIDPYLNYTDKNGNSHKILTRFYGVDNSISGGKANGSELYYGEYQFQRKFTNQNLVLTAGLVGILTNARAKLFGDTSYNTQNTAAYLQLDKKFFNKLNVSLGVRYEQNSLTGPQTVKISETETDTIPGGKIKESKPVFRLGLNYQAAKETYFRASFGQGYRFPTIAELFINTNAGFQISPNPKLTSETGWTSEIGVKRGFHLNEIRGFFDAALFWSQYNNMMEFTFNKTLFSFQSQNIGNTDIKGIELSVSGAGKTGSLLHAFQAGYTYIDPTFQHFTAQDSINSSTGTNVLKYRFRHTAKLDYEIKYKDFSFGAAGFYVSNMEAVDRIFALFIKGLQQFRDAHANGSATLDLRASYKPTNHFKISLIVANVFNEEYALRPALLDPTRNATIRVDYNF